MYICICNAVTEKQVHEAIDGGAITLDALHQALAVGSQCGNCRDCARQCIREKLGEIHVEFPLAYAA